MVSIKEVRCEVPVDYINPNIRMQKGGDLYRRPLTPSELVAPLTWYERQNFVVWRYGATREGYVGFARVVEVID